MVGRRFRILTLMLLTVLIAAACGNDDDDAAGDGDGVSGEVVTIIGAFVDDEAAAFETAVAPFEEETGIDIRYEGTPDFTELVRIRAEGDDLQDILMFPQPGLFAEFARDGQVVPLSGAALDAYNGNFDDAAQDLGEVDGTPYGIFFKASVKSLVWYPRPAFEDAGYEVPETFQELLDLSQQIVDDGGTPWCIGIEDGAATGWVGTDWVEDLVLRNSGPDVYDQWVNHEIPFDDPQIVEAFDLMGEIWLNPDFVRGGTQTILTTPFGDSPRPLFDDPPGCFLHRQASFITSFFPDDVQESLTTDEPRAGVFALPAIEPGPAPFLGGADIAAMTNERPAVAQTMAFLGSTGLAEGWAPQGGYFSPHQGFDVSLYPTAVDQQIGAFLLDAVAFRVDGSDQMPGAVGAGSFWSGIVDWVGGDSTEDVVGAIEASWPSD